MSQEQCSHFPVTLYIDGKCFLCTKEMNWLKSMDKKNNLQLVDIHNPEFKPPREDLTKQQLDLILHAKLNNGEIVKGIDAYYYSWAAVGLGWLAAPMRWRGVRFFSNKAYLLFAKNRHPLSSKFARLVGNKPCENGQCQIPKKK
ncbi:hypothetical protein ABPG74_002430 [Tetrahymena malaccensis]